MVPDCEYIRNATIGHQLLDVSERTPSLNEIYWYIHSIFINKGGCVTNLTWRCDCTLLGL